MGYIKCSSCGGIGGTLVKDGAGGYKHQRGYLCDMHRRRVAELNKKLKKEDVLSQSKSNLVVARNKPLAVVGSSDREKRIYRPGEK